MYHIWIEGMARAAGVEGNANANRHGTAARDADRHGLFSSLAYWVRVLGGISAGERRQDVGAQRDDAQSAHRPV